MSEPVVVPYGHTGREVRVSIVDTDHGPRTGLAVDKVVRGRLRVHLDLPLSVGPQLLAALAAVLGKVAPDASPQTTTPAAPAALAWAPPSSGFARSSLRRADELHRAAGPQRRIGDRR